MGQNHLYNIQSFAFHIQADKNRQREGRGYYFTCFAYLAKAMNILLSLQKQAAFPQENLRLT